MNLLDALKYEASREDISANEIICRQQAFRDASVGRGLLVDCQTDKKHWFFVDGSNPKLTAGKTYRFEYAPGKPTGYSFLFTVPRD